MSYFAVPGRTLACLAVNTATQRRNCSPIRSVSSPQLLELVDAAYAGLPRHRLSASPPRLRVGLLLVPGARSRPNPPAPVMFSAGGLLVGAARSGALVVVSPGERTALVAVPAELLHFPYHVRYELLEFAVFTLAARVQRLIPLHAACIGRREDGLLLMGPSGSGKSTLALQCLLEGLEFLSEDSVFLTPDTLLATGVANFLHVRADSLRWLGEPRAAALIRASPVIRRRSGVSKFELDLRDSGYPLAARALKIRAIVFLSAHRARKGPLLRRVPRSRIVARLVSLQAYAAGHPNWEAFSGNAARLEAFELRRGRHPRDGVAALRELLRPRARV